MRRQRREIDWVPTLGVAVSALTVYLVYTSLRLDRVIRNQAVEQAGQAERDKKAAADRDAIKERGTVRARRLTTALTIVSILVLALTIKGATNLLH